MTSSDAGATSSSISSPTAPLPMPMLLPTPSLTLSPVSITSDNSNHRPFAGGLLRRAESEAAAGALACDGTRRDVPRVASRNGGMLNAPHSTRHGRGAGSRFQHATHLRQNHDQQTLRKRHLAERHLAERHLVEWHIVEWHIVEWHI